MLGLGLGRRVQAVELAVDLVLQVAGEGREPDRGLVLFGPEAGGRDVAQGLADAGAGLGEDQVGRAGLGARGEGLTDRRGVVRLLRARLGLGAEKLGQARPGLGGGDRFVPGRRRRGLVAPAGQAGPDVETTSLARGGPPGGGACGGVQSRLAEGGEHARAPGPARAGHGPGDAGRVAVAFPAARAQLAQERTGGPAQGGGGAFQAVRLGQAEGRGQAAGRRRAEGGRPDEGVELEQVVGAEGLDAEPARGRASVAQKRRAGPRPLRRRRGREARGLALRGDPERLAQARDQDRRLGQEDAAWALGACRHAPTPISSNSSGKPTQSASASRLRSCARIEAEASVMAW